MMSLRVIVSSFGSMRRMMRFSLSVPKAHASPESAETIRFVRVYKYSLGRRANSPRDVDEGWPSFYLILSTQRLNTLATRRDRDDPSRVGRVRDGRGGAAPMAVKPAEGTVSQACRVCGGEVNPHGECVVCGTRQNESATAAPDKGTASWTKVDSSSGMGTWMGAGPAGGDSREDALRKWLAGEDTAFQDWIGVPATSGAPKSS